MTYREQCEAVVWKLEYATDKLIAQNGDPIAVDAMMIAAEFIKGMMGGALPLDPPSAYKDEWKGWNDFLGVDLPTTETTAQMKGNTK